MQTAPQYWLSLNHLHRGGPTAPPVVFFELSFMRPLALSWHFVSFLLSHLFVVLKNCIFVSLDLVRRGPGLLILYEYYSCGSVIQSSDPSSFVRCNQHPQPPSTVVNWSVTAKTRETQQSTKRREEHEYHPAPRSTPFAYLLVPSKENTPTDITPSGHSHPLV